MHIVLAVEARESSNTQDKLGAPLFGKMMAVYHPLGIAGEVAATSEPMQAQQCVYHARRGDHTLASFASLGIFFLRG